MGHELVTHVGQSEVHCLQVGLLGLVGQAVAVEVDAIRVHIGQAACCGAVVVIAAVVHVVVHVAAAASEPAHHSVRHILRRAIAVLALRSGVIAPALEPAFILRPHGRLVDQYTARLSVALQEARAVIAVARVDGVVGRRAVAHDPGHVDVEGVGHVAVPLHVPHVAAAQLVLDLSQHDGTASVGEVVARLVDDDANPLLHRRAPMIVVRAEVHTFFVRQPCRYTAVVPLGAHVGAYAQVSKQACVGDGIEEESKVAPSCPVVLSLHHLVVVPEHVQLDHVDTVQRRLLH